MSPLILDGNAASKAILDRLTQEIADLKIKHGKVPGLAVILVGNNPASEVYVGRKKKTCAQIGMKSFDFPLDPSVGEATLLKLIEDLNHNPDVHGILLQLPLPEGFDADKALNLIAPEKDVDGFHPVNVGKLLLGLPTFPSCTPFGVLALLDHYGISTTGKHVVIVGRSNIVGKPAAALFMRKGKGGDATVTVCHSQSKSIKEHTLQADIVVAAIGKPSFITADMIREGAVVVDVGINRVVDETHPKGYRIVGDVDYESVAIQTSAITPVPGGVGPMTIAMLMQNTVNAFKQTLG